VAARVVPTPAPVAQPAEADGLNPFQCGFESHRGHVTTPSTRPVRTPTTADLERAGTVVREHLRPTPLDRGPTGVDVDEPLLKLESTQPTGAFKVRGALNALTHIDPDTRVLAASAGNHGLGVAYAARRLGREVTIVVPAQASPAKVEALRRLGAEPVRVGTSYDAAEAHALELAGRGGCYVSPYNDPEVIAGQGTIGLELDDQVDGPMTVFCPIGGGGLASGMGLWASTRPDVRLIGVESEVSTAVSASVRAGASVEVEIGATIADGLEGNVEAGSVTVDLVGRHVDELVTVSDGEIRTALRWLASRRGVVAEGAGAAALAAILAGKGGVNGAVVAIVSGRNIALPLYAELLAES
jgi:threonine dehydratase